MSKAGNRLLDAAREVSAIARGEIKPAHIHIPADVDVKAIRTTLGLSQDAFALEFCFSVHQIRDWEQNRSRPLDSNRAYLLMIDRHPDVMRKMLDDLRKEMAETPPDEKIAAYR
ncbi:transcriptional regulator [Brucella intermedia]|uniref:helix-turn-helix domain-containing protein n=1 Tax=Brucella TaxID=234 RepID=UPI00158DEB8E|nr:MULTISPECIES: transcriptional regulator [Brucella]MCO7737536.1 transcriptional regulator [Brucella intermedia]